MLQQTLKKISKIQTWAVTALFLAIPGIPAPVAAQDSNAAAPSAKPDDSIFVMPKLPKGFTYYHDVEIGKGGSRVLKIDICAPTKKPAKPLPVVAMIHGGGWNKGHKNKFAGTLAKLAAQGYVTASLQYRLTPEGAHYPAQLHDVKLGIRYLKAHAATYFLDPEKIAAWGSSSGGHLAALLGTTGDVPSLEGDGGWNNVNSSITCVVNFSGPADFTTDFANKWSSVTKLLGTNAKADSKKALAAMPGTYASKNDARFLILHGDKDNIVPYTDSVTLSEQLKKAGTDVTFGIVQGAGHAMGSFTWTSDIAHQFLSYHLKGEGIRPELPQHAHYLGKE